MMDTLLREEIREPAWLSRSAALELQMLRESYAEVLEEGAAPLENTPEGVVWHTFAGGAVNRLLAVGLEQISGEKWVAGNLSLRCKDIAVTAAREAMLALSGIDWERTAASAARACRAAW